VKKGDSIHRAIGKSIDFLLVGFLCRFLPSWVGVFSGPLYILISDGFFHGQSVGKKLAGLRVVLTDAGKEGQRCTFRCSMVRNLPYGVITLLSQIPIFGGFIVLPLGILFLLVEAYFVHADEHGIRIGDIYAHTQVVDEAS
jgi:hypothetical protein